MNRLAIINKDNNLTSKTYEILKEYSENTARQFEIDIFELEEFVNKLKYSNSYLIVFLESVHDENTFTYLRGKLDEIQSQIYIVIVTSELYDGIKGYRINAFRCILNDKDIKRNIYECMESVFESEKQRKKLFKFKDAERVLAWRNIMYIESNLHKLIFHVVEESVKIYEMRGTMYTMETCSDEFMDVHKGYVVNLNYVKAMEQDDVILVNDERIPVSRNKRNEVKKRLEIFLKKQRFT